LKEAEDRKYAHRNAIDFGGFFSAENAIEYVKEKWHGICRIML
jgi:hypothetical protein